MKYEKHKKIMYIVGLIYFNRKDAFGACAIGWSPLPYSMSYCVWTTALDTTKFLKDDQEPL